MRGSSIPRAVSRVLKMPKWNQMWNHILITGASSGIGRALALLLGEPGRRLTLCGRSRERLENLAAELRGRGVAVTVLAGDLATVEGRGAVTAYLGSEAPDVVVNNAGAGLYGDVVDVPVDRLLEVAALDVTAVLELTVTAAKALVARGRGGTILNVSSVAAFPPFPGLAVYAASKAFVNQLSVSMDYELNPRGVRVLAACPGVVDTSFRTSAGGDAAATSAYDLGTMTAAYAAEQLRWQMARGRRLHVFDWRYRLLLYAARHLIPSRLTAWILHRSIQSLR